MQGSLFVNDRKQSDKHPDWSGSIKINGVEYWLSGWTKQGARGEFFSLAVKPKEQNYSRPQPQQQARQAPPPAQDESVIGEEDVPF